MPNKKQRLKSVRAELEVRCFENSLKVFNDDELERFQYLSTCAVSDLNEVECEELIKLEEKRFDNENTG
jgi:hypothetical protein